MNMTFEKIEHDPEYKVSFLTGVKVLEPIKYRVIKREETYWFFFTKTEYFIESDFLSMGPFESIEACMETLTMMRVGYRDIELPNEN